MERSAAIEKRRHRETALSRLLRQTGEFATAISRLALLVVILTPILLASFLTVDLPIRTFDGLFGGDTVLRPSNWLTRGFLIMSLAPLITILFARKYGGDEASRAITAAWGVAAIAVFAELSYLAPALEAGDMPPVRFTVVFVAAAMAAQYVAVGVYDVARGGGKWWRAPLFAALGGNIAFLLIYFPGIYWGAAAPWLNWAVAGFTLQMVLAGLFLPVYALVRRRLRPKGGFGGI